jgi:hypothetical protein
MAGNLKIEWVGAELEPLTPVDPAHPDGVDLVDSPEALAHCVALLTYPARGCGVWIIRCDDCRRTTHIRASGRADDPRSVSLACVAQLHGAKSNGS